MMTRGAAGVMMGASTHPTDFRTMLARIVSMGADACFVRVEDDHEAAMTLDAVCEAADRLSARTDLASASGYASDRGLGVDGDRGFMTVQAGDHVLHAYFVADNERVEGRGVRMRLMSVTQPRSDGSGFDGVEGMLTIADLKRLLRKIDCEDSPLAFAAAVVVPSA